MEVNGGASFIFFYSLCNMKTLRSLFIISSFSNGVFGDTGEVKTVSVMEGDSLTLHTDVTHIETDDVILWRFQSVRIAQINKAANIMSVYDTVLNGKFRDRLQVDHQTGDLTITNIRTEHTGLYQVEIIVGSESKPKIFSVGCVKESSTDGVKMVSVMKRDSVILHTVLTVIQRDDVIVWRFGPRHTIIAEINKTSDTYNVDGKLGDRLHLNHRNGDLTIRHIRNDTYGLYSLDITRSGKSFTIHKRFNVTESGQLGSFLEELDMLLSSFPEDGTPVVILDTPNRITVTEGDSVTLQSGVTEIQKDDVILWWFEDEDSPQAKINRTAGIFSTYDGADGRFRDRLQLDHQTGNLTITNIRTEDSGLYHVDITHSTHTKFTRFTVTVCEACLSSGESSGVSSGVIAGLFVPLLLVIAAAVAGVIYYRRRFFEVKEQLVMEGDSVILHTDVNTLNTDDEIEWSFEKTVIATIKRNNVNIADERFRDRLILSSRSGSLTISDIRTTDSGLYTLKHIRGRKTSYKRFRLTVTDTRRVIMVNEGQSYTLQTHVTEIQTDDVIEWMFGDEETLIAKIHKKNNISRTYDGDEDLFKNTLELKDQTGDLTIKNITNEHSGDYKLKTIRGGETSYRRFQVSVTDSVEINQPLIN